MSHACYIVKVFSRMNYNEDVQRYSNSIIVVIYYLIFSYFATSGVKMGEG